MATGAVAGGIVGGVLGLAGNFLQAQQAKRAQTRFRRRQRRAIQEARTFADQTADRIQQNPLFASARDFLQGTFDEAGASPLVQDFQRQIQASQASRGLFFGGASAAGEAGGLAVAAQRLRQDLLPNIRNFTLLPEQVRQQTLSQEATLRSAAATGAPLPGLSQPAFIDPLSAGIQGAIQGGTAGAAVGGEFFPGDKDDTDGVSSRTPSERLRGDADFQAANFLSRLRNTSNLQLTFQ